MFKSLPFLLYYVRNLRKQEVIDREREKKNGQIVSLYFVSLRVIRLKSKQYKM